MTLLVFFLFFFAGCCDHECQSLLDAGVTGGGRDAVLINMPFASGDSYRCSQGAGGVYSHTGTATRYDADFDTRNDADEIVYAPAGGVAYVHDDDPYTNFGYHVNIDQGDGSYIILAHLSSVFVEDGSEVTAGQLVGFEGTTGNSTGDHLHIGRHSGDASKDGVYGTSLEGLEFSASDATLGSSVSSIPVTDLSCDLTAGHFYMSVLPVALWHPNGSLVKTPSQSTVYLIEGGALRAFITEDSFVSRNYDFSDVALVSDAELECFAWGSDITTSTQIEAVYDDEGGSGVWLLVGSDTDPDRFREKVGSLGWQGVLKSWGVSAATYDDLSQDSDLGGIIDAYPLQSGSVTYRDGTLVSPSDASDVYLMSDGIAMPIVSWDVYLLAGFWNRTVLEVDRSEFDSVVSVRGSCGTDTYCITEDDLATCGGKSEESEGTFTAVGGSSDTGVGEEDSSEAPEETASEGGSSEDAKNTLSLTWTTPSGVRADRITLSGEYTPSGGVAQGWASNLAESKDSSLVSYTQSFADGDSLRFSVEYEISGSVSWSCLAPFPSGTVQGSATASWNGVAQSVIAVDDPSSDGCGLSVTVHD